ncbi:MAG TPA: S8 family serine peptidase [Gammaproteobacteria bacterium]|nr:S8 family serine peptidase [Gammaproteobacteria bacterium]
MLALLASVAVGLPAAAQLLDSTLDDLLDQTITEQVEQDVAQAVEEVVEQQVESGVVEQIQEQVTGAVEQQLESQIVDTVQQQVESGVVEQIQEEVTGAVEQTLESEIVDTVQQQVENGVVAEIATQVEDSVVGEIGDRLLDTVEGEIGNLSDDVTTTVRGVSETAGGLVDAAGNVAADAAAPPARFAPDLDPLGRTIEGETWIILVPAEYADRIASWGFTIRERQDLATLNRVLLRVAAPEDRDIAQAALELALDAPGTEVDFNHVYRPGAERNGDGVTAMPAVPAAAAPHTPAPARSVGIVDTSVAVEHEALRDADIVQRDFVEFTNERPTAHGTAVASILVGDSARLRAQFRGGRVYAASVFFRDDKGDDATTAASLTLAGEWLAAEGVRVINMSLAGPPNRVLEAAIAALVERGVIVVAAVGNNGPTGEPLYPAAYANVVGVTAVDAAQRVYRYANRGPHVRFAAPGVDIRVAKSGGGYREMTGTSVAAPHAAAVIANTIASRTGATPTSVVAELERAAHDLGAKDFDSVFGFGLIAPLTPVTASR